MSKKANCFLINRLSEWGIGRVFGFPGDGINEVMRAQGRQHDKVDISDDSRP